MESSRGLTMGERQERFGSGASTTGRVHPLELAKILAESEFGIDTRRYTGCLSEGGLEKPMI